MKVLKELIKINKINLLSPPAGITDCLDPSTKREYVKEHPYFIKKAIIILEGALQGGEFMFGKGRSFEGDALKLYNIYSKALGEIEPGMGSSNYYYEFIRDRLTDIKKGLYNILKDPLNAKREDYDKAYRLFSKVFDNRFTQLNSKSL